MKGRLLRVSRDRNVRPWRERVTEESELLAALMRRADLNVVEGCSLDKRGVNGSSSVPPMFMAQDEGSPRGQPSSRQDP